MEKYLSATQHLTMVCNILPFQSKRKILFSFFQSLLPRIHNTLFRVFVIFCSCWKAVEMVL